MSELAYNQHGDRFEVPADAVYWRVRRFKVPGTRGAPEVVYDHDGLPLSVPIDISMDEFREAVDGTVGRYRLDHLDDQGGSAGDTAAYIQAREQIRKETKRAVLEVDAHPQDTLIRELIRANTEMTRVITERFAQMMESAAVLVRAADGAGIAARKPSDMPALPTPSTIAQAPAEEPEGDDENQPMTHSVLANVPQMALEKAMPLISHAIHTKVMGLSSAQSMAFLGHSTPQAPMVQSTHAEQPTATMPNENGPDEGYDGSEADDEAQHGRPSASFEKGKTATPSPLAFVSHLAAIESHLSADDIDAIKTLMSALSADELVRWKEKLMLSSPADAPVLITDEVRERQKKGRGT